MAKVVSKKKVAAKAPAFKVKQEVVVHNTKADEYYYGVITKITDKGITVKEDDETVRVYLAKDVFDKKQFEKDNPPDEEATDDIAEDDIQIDDDIDSAIIDDEATDEESEEEEPAEDDASEESESEEEPVGDEPEEEETLKVDEEDEPKESSDAWFAVGDDSDADFKGPQQQTFRVWMPQDNKPREFTIITEAPFTFKEHAVKMGGSFRNYFTCIAPMGQRCPLCESKNRPYVAKAFYVIDHTPYKDKAQKVHKDQIRLLVMKGQSYTIFRARLQAYFEKAGRELRYLGVRFAATRTDGDKVPGVGNIFDILKVVKLPDKMQKPMKEIQAEFTPLTRKAMAQQINFIEPDEQEEE